MSIIGRKNEQDTISGCLESNRPEFLIVLGRRRVGKTYLIREFFNDHFSFYCTGIPDEKTRNQLKAFNESLISYGDNVKAIPKDWFEAFRRLRIILEKEDIYRDKASGKKVVFFDEVPWMDTVRSDFKSAFDFFWNSWGSVQKDLLLIVCGSATSWIINNILDDKGGFHNRITKKMYIHPFNLGECEEYYKSNGISLSRDKIIESYMIFGGIPYYLNLLDKRYSLDQNIDNLIFDNSGDLHFEFDHLFKSLFKKAENHEKVIQEMIKVKKGVRRSDLAGQSGISNGEGLTNTLRELEQCGFIRKYDNLTTEKRNCFYQITDPFVIFYMNFVKNNKIKSWESLVRKPEYYAWRGNAFEIVCLNHIAQIKGTLGISGVESMEYSWRSKKKKGGAQIDLLIDRRDDIINICEMKCTDKEFIITDEYRKELQNKVDTFIEEVNPKKSVHVTLISSNGIKRNEYTDIVQSIIDSDKLFA